MTDTDTDGPEHRAHFRSRPGDVQLRETAEEAEEDDIMEIRMPVASTGEVRNQGDDPLARSELKGMARQINDGTIGIFPEHGMDDMVATGHYSQFEKLGYWTDGTVETEAAADGEDMLMATARMPDPNSLPDLGQYRVALGIIKEQAKREVPIDSSIGWRTDEDYPGGNDLMEVSIVGIGADPRTNTAGADPVATVTRAAVDAGADPGDLLEQVRASLPEDARPFGPPEDPNRWEDFDACVADVSDWDGIDDPEAYCGALKNVSEQDADAANAKRDHSRATYEVGDESIDITPPEPMVNAAREGLDAKERFDDLSDCGTGVGEDRARQIIADEVGPEVIDEIAAYLTSHAEDVQGIDDPPTDWSEEQWTDGCGPVQYALWGGTATGTGRDWAQQKANDVAEAKGEQLPYERMTEDTDPPDDGGTTDEQTADDPDESQGDDGETITRAPEDVTEEDLMTFVAMHFEGMDEEDLMEAVDAADGEYIGECDPEALADLVSTATGAEYGDVTDAMDALMEGNTDEDQGDYEDDDGDDEDDTDEEDEMNTSSVADEVADLREELNDLRGRLADGESPSDVTESPETDEDRDAAESEATEGEDTDPDEQRDNDGPTLRDEWLST